MADAQVPGRPALVLLVEDHSDTLEMYREWLLYSGFRVVCSTSADDGLRQARELRPDVIATELALTCRDGCWLCEALRRHPATRAIPVIAITSWASEEYRARARAFGCTAMLLKPAMPDAIVAEIDLALARGPRQATA